MSAKRSIYLAFGALAVAVLWVNGVGAVGASGASRVYAARPVEGVRWDGLGQAYAGLIGASVPLTTTTPTPTFTMTATPTPCSMGFSDVVPSEYFYDDVRWLYCHGAISGYADGTFRPYNNVTRGQLSKIEVLAFDIPLNPPPEPPPWPPFCGVPSSNPFYIYIRTLYYYMYGGPPFECEFRPDSNATRGQVAKIVTVTACWPLYTPPVPTFRDVPTTNPFYPQIETAYSRGIISGYSCGGPGEPCPGLYFRPNNLITRGQAGKITHRAVMQGSMCPTGTPTPTPVSLMEKE